MAYSSTLYSNQDAGKTDYALDFSGPGNGYLDSSHIKLYRDRVLQDSSEFTFTDPLNVVLVTPTTAGEDILWRRETPKDDPLVDFELDAVLTDDDLDIATLQTLYITHEVLDGYITLGSAGYTDFNGRRLINVADGIDDTDGVNLLQVQTIVANAEVLVKYDEIIAAAAQTAADAIATDADATHIDAVKAAIDIIYADIITLHQNIQGYEMGTVIGRFEYNNMGGF